MRSFLDENQNSHMKVLGCLVYARNIETRGDKFEVRGRPGVFNGYPHGMKGYKAFNIRDKNIIISRDVKFVENDFHFMNPIPHDNQAEDNELLSERLHVTPQNR